MGLSKVKIKTYNDNFPTKHLIISHKKLTLNYLYSINLKVGYDLQLYIIIG